MVRTFSGHIRDGKIELHDKTGFRLTLDALEGSQITLRIGKLKAHRSLEANSYYWGVVVKEISEYTGYTAEEVHDAMKWRFLRHVDDNGFETVGSTADLDTGAFAGFVDNVTRFAVQELGLTIAPAERVA